MARSFYFRSKYGSEFSSGIHVKSRHRRLWFCNGHLPRAADTQHAGPDPGGDRQQRRRQGARGAASGRRVRHAASLVRAAGLIACADAAGRLLSVFHNRRWDADFLTVRQLLAAGTLGRVTYFESHFDRYRPQVQTRWREADLPGSGLWYDLGPHLLDQALQLFGAPQGISLDLMRQRDGAATDDWFHAVLRYEGLRVVLHASALTAQPGARYTVHGTAGSFVKQGLDPQEDALKAGTMPGGAGWGIDPQPGVLTTPGADGVVVAARTHQGVDGDYGRYYAAIRDAIRGVGANPVPAQQALQVMQWLALGQQSWREGRTVGAAG